MVFKVLLSNLSLESQALWAVFAFQGLSAPPGPQRWQRLAGSVGQTKIHKTKVLLKTRTMTETERHRVFRMKGTGVVGLRTKGGVEGGGTEKTERDCRSTCPRQVSIQAPTHLLPERAGDGGSTLSTAHRSDQAWKPASCASFLGPQPTDGTSTHASTSI